LSVAHQFIPNVVLCVDEITASNSSNNYCRNNISVGHSSLTVTNSSILKCVSFNARSLKNKLNDLHFVLYGDTCAFDIVCISETWLSKSVSNAMLDPQNLYNIFRLDRKTTTNGGGVCIFTKRYLNVVEVEIAASFESVECVCIDVYCTSGSKIRLLTIYRPGGNSTSAANLMKILVDCLNSLCTFDVTCVIAGDLNCASIDWSNNVLCSDPIQRTFLDAVCELGFQQYVDHPTRECNILDVVLSNDPLLILDVSVTPPFSTSDHCSVEFVLNNCHNSIHSIDSVNQAQSSLHNKVDTSLCYKLWKKADWSSMKIFLSHIDWECYLHKSLDGEQCWDNFISVLNCVIDKFVPSKQSVNASCRSKKISYPITIRKLLIRKAMLWRKYRKRRTKHRKKAYNEIANRCKLQIERHATDREGLILKSADLGKFYRFVNSKLSSKSGIGPLKNSKGDFVFRNKHKAELLNNYFSSICTKDDEVIPLFPSRMQSENGLETIKFREHDLFKIISKLKCSLSAGPDGLPPILFKNLSAVLSKPVTIVCRSVFSSGILPAIWKSAFVTPVFKKGRASCIENYRPISLTCVTCKIFESVIKNQIQDFLLQNDLLNKGQHGFIAGHSTGTNLLESLNEWTINLKNGNCTRVAHIDFTRAFDSVCHSKLLLKLSKYGIKGNLLQIIESFLSDRSQRVAIENEFSNTADMISGVPQGSVLGPLLFLVYINDLADVFPQKVISKYFADDAKLYTEVETGNDIDELQFSLDLLADWARTWQLGIAVLKCSTIDIAHSKKVGAFCENNIDGNLLVNKTEVTDLGIVFDSGLNFTPHITQIVGKAKQRIFLIFRAFKTRDTRLLLIAYKSYILPMLDYCSSVWSPALVYNIAALESVQRLFTRRLTGLSLMKYSDRLRILNIPSLELRRLRTDLVLCYKILNGLVAGAPEKYGLILSNVSTRGHDMKLFKEHARVEERRNYFGNRIIDPWNALPQETVQSCSIIAFKRNLLLCNLTKYLRQDFDGTGEQS
jgi:ribonuclease P/MRP protein subunit RPP40